MSALPCGCDTESLWICEEHRPKTGTVQQESLTQYKEEAVRIAKQTPMPPNFKALTEGTWPSDPSPAEQFRAAAVFTASAVLTRDDLLNRIATLEAELTSARKRYDKRNYELKFVIRMLESEKADFQKRIAGILARFYTEPLSLSSVQPLIALALELNHDLAEQRR